MNEMYGGRENRAQKWREVELEPPSGRTVITAIAVIISLFVIAAVLKTFPVHTTTVRLNIDTDGMSQRHFECDVSEKGIVDASIKELNMADCYVTVELTAQRAGETNMTITSEPKEGETGDTVVHAAYRIWVDRHSVIQVIRLK